MTDKIITSTFDEIEVKRIRVVDENGNTRLVLSSPPMPDGTIRGKPIAVQNRKEAGILFFTEEGTECGGLIFGGNSKGKYPAGGQLSLDAYEQDQVLTIFCKEFRGKRSYGIRLSERPLYPLTELLARLQGVRKYLLLLKRKELRELKESHAPRLFLGRERDGEVGLSMMDSKGKPRLRISVDANDNPRMEVLDRSGKVIRRLPSAD